MGILVLWEGLCAIVENQGHYLLCFIFLLALVFLPYDLELYGCGSLFAVTPKCKNRFKRKILLSFRIFPYHLDNRRSRIWMDLWISFCCGEHSWDSIAWDIESSESNIGHDRCTLEFFDKTIDIEWRSQGIWSENFGDDDALVRTNRLNFRIHICNIRVRSLYLTIQIKIVDTKSNASEQNECEEHQGENPRKSILELNTCLCMIDLHTMELWILSWA